MVIARSLEEIKERLKPIDVIETEDFYWVLKDKEKGYFKVFKPRPREETQHLLREGGFPERYIRLLGSIKRTKAIEVIKRAKRGAHLWGPAGVGKTTACVYKIAKWLQHYRVHTPLYISAFDLDYERVQKLKESADCFLIDDLNPAVLRDLPKSVLIDVIYHAHAKEKRLLITSNEGRLQLPEPVKSRILEMCDVVRKIEGHDMRIKEVKA